MKKKKYLPHIASALMLVPMVGCQGLHSDPDGECTTRSRIELEVHPRALGGITRAITDAQDPSVAGIIPEDKIVDGQLFIDGIGLTGSHAFMPTEDRWSAKFEEEIAESTTKRRIATLINGSRLALRGTNYDTDSKVSLDDLDKMIGESFLMTSTFDDQQSNFYPLSKEGCTDVRLEVERVVSKAQLRRAKDPDTETMEARYGTIDYDAMRWTIAGSAKECYLFADHAGELHLGEEGLYVELKTLSAHTKSHGTYDLMKLSDTGLSQNFKARAIPLFENGKVKNNDGGISTSDRIYFLEHALTETTTEHAYGADVTYADVTYVKIYAGLAPTKGFRIDNSKVAFARHKVFESEAEARTGFMESDPAVDEGAERPYTPELLDDALLSPLGTTAPTDRWYWVDVTDTEWLKSLSDEERTKHTLREGKDYSASDPMTGPTDPKRRTYLLVHDSAETFYYGLDDHTIYDTLLAALAGGNNKIRKYEGGKTVYLSPLNEQRNTEGLVFSCDTRRNNIYDLILNGISGLGLNYDPVDPKDPNLPAPGDNPWEPEPKIPPINGRDNVIRITATPLWWNTMDHVLELK